jgi:AcrR family transcriptional regulator
MTDTATAPESVPKPGLRERKKARTRAQLQEHALRLFREQGYQETTVEEIAEAAEVSPTTVYRYFPTKPDLVIYDDLDEVMIEAFRSQPPELTAVQAMRATLRSGLDDLLGEELELQRERWLLIRDEPELRAAMLDELTRTMSQMADLIAERAHRPRNDDEVVALAGALIGMTIAAWMETDGDEWMERFISRFDTGAAKLETGFDL